VSASRRESHTRSKNEDRPRAIDDDAPWKPSRSAFSRKVRYGSPTVDSTHPICSAYSTEKTALYRFNRGHPPPPFRFRDNEDGCFCAAAAAPAAAAPAGVGAVHLGRYTRTDSIRFESHSLSIARASSPTRRSRRFAVRVSPLGLFRLDSVPRGGPPSFSRRPFVVVAIRSCWALRRTLLRSVFHFESVSLEDPPKDTFLHARFESDKSRPPPRASTQATMVLVLAQLH
jgi:hypothetical protein